MRCTATPSYPLSRFTIAPGSSKSSTSSKTPTPLLSKQHAVASTPGVGGSDDTDSAAYKHLYNNSSASFVWLNTVSRNGEAFEEERCQTVVKVLVGRQTTKQSESGVKSEEQLQTFNPDLLSREALLLSTGAAYWIDPGIRIQVSTYLTPPVGASTTKCSSNTHSTRVLCR